MSRHIKTLEARVQQRDPLIALIRLIMVISTRANIAVKLYPVPNSYYLNISHISGTARLPRLKEETKTHPNKSTRQSHIKTMEVNVRQRDPLIALIRAIIVISTRDAISVNYINKNVSRDRVNLEPQKHEQRGSNHIAIESIRYNRVYGSDVDQPIHASRLV